ncbi:MAG: hypothetical protein ACOYL1_03330 [Chlamydiia bacterium]
MKKVILAMVLLLSSCQKQQIEVEHFAVSKKNLPSTFTLSPDPQQEEGYFGEIFLIHYTLTDKQLGSKTPVIAQFLLEDLQEFQTEFIPTQKRGFERLEWINESFQKHGAVIGYQVCYQDFCLKSPLFRKMIEVDHKRLAKEKNGK